MRRQNPAQPSPAPTVAVAAPAATAEPRKRSRAADASPMEAIINGILIANQQHNNSDHTLPSTGLAGGDSGEHEGADNSQRNKARNQKQKR
jgi:hypothetical protein